MAADSKVETISRLAQWRIDNFGACTYKRSDPFKLGLWNWNLSIEKNRYMYIRLYPEPSRASKEQPPVARFILRVSNTGANRRFYISPSSITSSLSTLPFCLRVLKPNLVKFDLFLEEYVYLVSREDYVPFGRLNVVSIAIVVHTVHERLLRTSDDFVWPVDSTFLGRFVIDVEFLDLKISPINGGEATSIWPSEGSMQPVSTQSALRCLSHMLNDTIHADVTIHTADGSLRAHKAILSASSPVFQSMFLHDLIEKESSTIEIQDMSQESCMALLSYLYGTIKQEDFWKHRLALLGAANKYDITSLKDSCEDSLMEDINSGNVLERLQEAWLYQLNKLKRGCLMYLFDFGKIYDVRDEIGNFFREADRELTLEMFQEVLTVWKPV